MSNKTTAAWVETLASVKEAGFDELEYETADYQLALGYPTSEFASVEVVAYCIIHKFNGVIEAYYAEFGEAIIGIMALQNELNVARRAWEDAHAPTPYLLN